MNQRVTISKIIGCGRLALAAGRKSNLAITRRNAEAVLRYVFSTRILLCSGVFHFQFTFSNLAFTSARTVGLYGASGSYWRHRGVGWHVPTSANIIINISRQFTLTHILLSLLILLMIYNDKNQQFIIN